VSARSDYSIWVFDWDSGTNAVDEPKRILDVRAAAIKRFDERRIRPNDPMSSLEDAFVPIYLYHRYQQMIQEGTVKNYSVRRGPASGPSFHW
jgi:hypothetical protein